MIIQDSDTKNIVSIQKFKIIFDWKFTPFLKKMNIMKKNIKIIICDNTGENKTLG